MAGTWTTYTDDTLAWTIAPTAPGIGFGANQAGLEKYNGCLSEFYLTNEYLDLTSSANREKFRGSDGKPVSLGATGTLPTGTQPLCYFPDGDFSNQQGSAGTPTLTGSLDACSSSPSD